MNIFESAIKNHIKERDDLFPYKSVKVAMVDFHSIFDGNNPLGALVKYKVCTTHKLNKTEGTNGAIWSVVTYKDGHCAVYFEGSFRYYDESEIKYHFDTTPII